MPGFRGVLAVIDSQLLAAPFAYMVFTLLSKPLEKASRIGMPWCVHLCVYPEPAITGGRGRRGRHDHTQSSRIRSSLPEHNHSRSCSSV